MNDRQCILILVSRSSEGKTLVVVAVTTDKNPTSFVSARTHKLTHTHTQTQLGTNIVSSSVYCQNYYEPSEKFSTNLARKQYTPSSPYHRVLHCHCHHARSRFHPQPKHHFRHAFPKQRPSHVCTCCHTMKAEIDFERDSKCGEEVAESEYSAVPPQPGLYFSTCQSRVIISLELKPRYF